MNEESIPKNGEFKTFFNNYWVRQITLLLILLSISFLVPVLVGFGKSGFSTQEVLNRFNVYQIFIYAGTAVVITGLAFLFVFDKFKKNGSKFNSVFFSSPGELPSPSYNISFFKTLSNTQLFLLSLIIFSIPLLINFASPKQTIFTGIVSLEQQFTPFDNIIFSSALVPIAENFGLQIVLVLVVVFMVFLDKKFNLSDNTTVAVTFLLGVFLSTAYWIINHIMRYGSSGYNMLIVAFFGFVLGAITILTGSFIPGWVLHFLANLFVDLKTYFSSSATTIIVGFIIFLLIIIYIRVYIIKTKK